MILLAIHRTFNKHILVVMTTSSLHILIQYLLGMCMRGMHMTIYPNTTPQLYSASLPTWVYHTLDHPYFIGANYIILQPLYQWRPRT